MFHTLRSGRVVQTTIRDSEGKPTFYEVLDTRTNARRVVYGDSWFDLEERSRSDGPAICTEEVPDVVEFFLEDEQSYWRWPNTLNRKLIVLPGAFPFCAPRVGDRMQDQSGTVYVVKHAPKGAFDLPWNGCVLFDREVANGAYLRWMKDHGRDRNLVSFHADDGRPSSPVPGEEDSQSDVGTLYRGVVAPTITYFLDDEQPATVGPKPFGRDKELKPRCRQEFLDPTRPQITIRIWGQWMEALYRFRCLHPRAAVAGQLGAWFKRFVRNNTPSLRSSGIKQLLFMRRQAVPRKELGGDHVAARDVTFYFQTEELTVEESSNLIDVDIQIGAQARQLTREPDMLGWQGVNPFTGLYDESGNYAWGSIDIADFRQTGTP
jgi:hypothetical protein